MAYTKIYSIPFSSLDGFNYEVEIYREGESNTKVQTLTGGKNTFIVDINDDDFLYTPIRSSGATLKIVGGDYLRDLFSTSYQKHFVNLSVSGTSIWKGFIVPDVYSQDYDNTLFEFEIECVSCLASLEYIDFAWDESQISLYDLIKLCLDKSRVNEVGSKFDAYYMDSYNNLNLKGMYVSTSNFFDEEGKAMNLKECLEEVCKFFNWTLYDSMPAPKFIDVDYLLKCVEDGATEYTMTDLYTGGTSSFLINSSTFTSAGTGDTFSILGGYNKATVIDSDYEVDSDQLFPDIEDCRELDLGSQSREAGKDGKKIEKDGDKYKNGYYKYFYKYWNSNKLEFVTYKYNSGSWVEDSYDSLYSAGARIIEQANANQEDKPTSLTWQKMYEIKLFDGTTVDKDKLLDGWYVPVTNNQMPDISQLLKPTIRLTKSAGGIVFPSDGYLGIKYKMSLTPELNSPQFRGVPEALEHKDDTMSGMGIKDFDEHARYYFIPMQIQIGNKYWNGSSWTTTQSVVRILADVAKDTHLEGKWINNKNTNTYDLGVDDLGDSWVIPLTSGLVGEFKVTIYVPYYETSRSKAYVYIKDLEFDVSRSKPIYNTKKEKQDTKYTNVVNGEYINEAEDIKFKLTSLNDSELSYSKVYTSNGIVDTLSSKVFGSIKPEKCMIERIIKQYKQPKIKLFRTIQNDFYPFNMLYSKDGITFIFTGGRIDYEYNTIEANVIQLH